MGRFSCRPVPDLMLSWVVLPSKDFSALWERHHSIVRARARTRSGAILSPTHARAPAAPAGPVRVDQSCQSAALFSKNDFQKNMKIFTLLWFLVVFLVVLRWGRGRKKDMDTVRLHRHNSCCGVGRGALYGAGGENPRSFEQLDIIWRPKTSADRVGASHERAYAT